MKPCAALRIAAIYALSVLPSQGTEIIIRYPAVSQRTLNTVLWTGTQFVAAGDNGAVHVSPDGISWTTGELPDAPSILCGATGNGHIVLAGEKGVLATSTDGIHWTAGGGIASELSQFFSIQSMAFNGTVFRATSVNSGGNWTSANGTDWTTLTTTSSNDRLAVKGAEFLAWPFAALTDQPQTLMHDTGSGWTLTTTSLTQSMRHLVWDGFRFISVGNAGAAATSADGTTWTPRNTGVTAALVHVIWTGSLAVAIGSGGTIITSPNGAAWTARASGTTSNLNSVAWSGSGLVAVGKDGVIVLSTDGTAWTV
ncbi:MAG TPA: hypothetical protein VHM91_21455, partial [Verrucomicrobiales bacterium]|nr:hypothetical protein [Verrucomicrobiales bacterium]